MSGSDAKLSVAFIGLGTMGHPMARRLAEARHRLTVFDIAGPVAQAFATEFGATAAADPAEAASGAQFVILMLPSSKEVGETVLGSDGKPGLLSRLAPGAIVIDMSSSDPIRTRELAQAVSDAGFSLVDAPVSGAVRRARDGTLSIMFGGPDDALARCRPLLERMGSAIFHVGAVGAGHAMKALNNYVSAAGLVATVEALHVGEKFGVRPEVMTQVLNASTGKNNTTEHKVAQFMLSGTYASGFLLRLMAKDVGIAMGLADHLGVPAELGHRCAELWKWAASNAPAAADHTEMYRLLDQAVPPDY